MSANDSLLIGTKRYSSWSLRGWLAVRLAELEVSERVIALGSGTTPAIATESPSGMVPVLRHNGAEIWDSLAIGEYCAELRPELWPRERVARARARSVAAEMHSGFRSLRIALPMNTGRRRAPAGGLTAEVVADVSRMERIWQDTRAAFGEGGPFLFGERFTLADAMFAPVVARFIGYEVVLGAAAGAYRDAVRAHPLVERWYREADAEPAAWRLDKYESVA